MTGPKFYSPVETSAELALSVTCHADHGEVHAAVHEIIRPERQYAELRMALFSGGLGLMEIDSAGTAESLERPPDCAELKGALLRRLHKLAGRFDVPLENWRFFTSQSSLCRSLK